MLVLTENKWSFMNSCPHDTCFFRSLKCQWELLGFFIFVCFGLYIKFIYYWGGKHVCVWGHVYQGLSVGFPDWIQVARLVQPPCLVPKPSHRLQFLLTYKILYRKFRPQTLCITRITLDSWFYGSKSPKYWDYKYWPPHPSDAILGWNPGFPNWWKKPSTNWTTS